MHVINNDNGTQDMTAMHAQLVTTEEEEEDVYSPYLSKNPGSGPGTTYHEGKKIIIMRRQLPHLPHACLDIAS